MLDDAGAVDLHGEPNGLCGQRREAATPSGSRGARWHVVATYSQAETMVTDRLAAQGFEAYCPTHTVIRTYRRLNGARARVEVPLFPGYVFTRFDPKADQWGPIRHTFGVYQLLTTEAGVPAPVPAGVVEALQAAAASRAVPAAPSSPWAPGAACSLRTGSLAGHHGVVLSVAGAKARVAVMLFGGITTATVSTASLVARD